MSDLRVTLIQTELAWENIPANLAHFDRILADVSGDTDLIILPEMFTTGFTMNAAAVAEKMDGSAVKWLKKTTQMRKVDILGSLVISENGAYFNRLIWATPKGEIRTYDKRHLFRMLGEDQVYRAGETALVGKLKGWRIKPFICYDLRFPVWSRNCGNHYDLAIYIANWPAKRAQHWKTLLQARAIENQCYVIGVNRVGSDANGLTYSGDSAVMDPQGHILFHQAHQACAHSARLYYDALEVYRKEFPAWRDADHDLVDSRRLT
jgi:predicted amidohydrolase